MEGTDITHSNDYSYLLAYSDVGGAAIGEWLSGSICTAHFLPLNIYFLREYSVIFRIKKEKQTLGFLGGLVG